MVDILSFQSFVFPGVAAFRGATFSGNAIFRLASFKRPASFMKARFKKDTNFSAIYSEKSFGLRDARFRVVPDFSEAAFHAPPVLDEIHIEAQAELHARPSEALFSEQLRPEYRSRRMTRLCGRILSR